MVYRATVTSSPCRPETPDKKVAHAPRRAPRASWRPLSRHRGTRVWPVGQAAAKPSVASLAFEAARVGGTAVRRDPCRAVMDTWGSPTLVRGILNTIPRAKGRTDSPSEDLDCRAAISWRPPRTMPRSTGLGSWTFGYDRGGRPAGRPLLWSDPVQREMTWTLPCVSGTQLSPPVAPGVLSMR